MSALPGRSVQQEHWKDSTSRKQENSSRSANRILSTVPPLMEITAAREVSWIMLLSTSKPTVESIPKLVTRMRVQTGGADSKKTTLERGTLVRKRGWGDQIREGTESPKGLGRLHDGMRRVGRSTQMVAEGYALVQRRLNALCVCMYRNRSNLVARLFP